MRARRVAALFFLFACMFSNNAVASPTLQKNSTGKEVLLLQKKLQSIGYTVTELDGEFGEETRQAVLAFQHDHKIYETGIVNHATWRVLKDTESDPEKLRAILDMEMESVSEIEDEIESNVDEEFYTDEDVPVEKIYINYGEVFLPRDTVFDIIDTARNYIGVPYVFGGEDPTGFDCSGFIKYIFDENGYDLPRLADEQYKLGIESSDENLIPGDLVFFSTYEEGASHVGIYLGEGEFIHASSSKGISISSLDDEYWSEKYIGGKAIVQ